MITVIAIPNEPFIPKGLCEEWLGLVLPEAAEVKNFQYNPKTEFVLHMSEVTRAFHRVGKNFAAWYFEQILGGGYVRISKRIAVHV